MRNLPDTSVRTKRYKSRFYLYITMPCDFSHENI